MGNITHLQDFFPEEDYFEILNTVNKISTEHEYHLSWRLTGQTQKGKPFFWNCSLSEEDFFANYLLEKIKKNIYDVTGETIIKCARIYLNGATFGQQGYLHVDSFEYTSRTLLIYCKPEWKKEWGGGTLFDCDDGSEKIFFPRPNSGVYFDSTIFHHSQPSSKDFNGLRVTLAYKLYIEGNDK